MSRLTFSMPVIATLSTARVPVKMTDGEVYIIRPENTLEGRPILDYVDISVEELIDVIWTDIKQNLKEWAEFTTQCQ